MRRSVSTKLRMCPAKRRRRRKGFYAEGVPGPDEAVEGATGEWPEDVVETMRLRVAEVLSARPEDVGLLLKSGQALLRAALAERRLSGRSERDFKQRMQRVLDELGPQLLPPDGGGTRE